MSPPRARSFGLDASVLRDLLPALDVRAYEITELARARRRGLRAFAHQELLHLGGGERAVDFRVQLRNDVLRHARGREDAPPELDVVALCARIGERRQAGCDGRRLERRDADAP